MCLTYCPVFYCNSKLSIRYETLKSDVNKDYTDYLERGLTLITNLKHYYQKADITYKQKLITAVFPEAITYDNGICRTTRENEVIRTLKAFFVNENETKSVGRTSKNRAAEKGQCRTALREGKYIENQRVKKKRGSKIEASPFMGERRDSNPRPPEPQSGVLTN